MNGSRADAAPGPRGRIAPTPSGYLHAGNAFNFLLTERLVRHLGGHLLLRIDDLDVGRMRPEFVEDIFRSLEWLGIAWDDGPSGPDALERVWSQRHRSPQYRKCLSELRERGALYACDHSRTSLLEDRSPGKPYCAHRSGDLPFDAPGAVWRLRVPEDTRIVIQQFDKGGEEVDLMSVMPDPVLRVRDGRPGYQIASLCDDLVQGIDLIVRGADLLPSSACQTHLARVLGRTAFMDVRFVHHGLIFGQDGLKLSKSAGADSLKAMRERNADPTVLKAMADKKAMEILEAHGD
ncbi:MAG: hypothetical protein H6594_04930 [Flavobacteriales bacterium]|nr:hypothetical protein [Flavobacteriales bacterium]